jgi:hypothetical protein
MSTLFSNQDVRSLKNDQVHSRWIENNEIYMAQIMGSQINRIYPLFYTNGVRNRLGTEFKRLFTEIADIRLPNEFRTQPRDDIRMFIIWAIE